jgi:hypothetical protein
MVFLHGWQSVTGGVKPTFLAQYGHGVVNPKLPDAKEIKTILMQGDDEIEDVTGKAK